MPLTVKRITLWRRESEDRTGLLADTLGPLTSAGTSLKVVMGYRVPGHEKGAVIELFPVAGKKATEAARSAGLTPSSIPTLLVEGDDRAGLGHDLARAVAGAGISMSFLMAQVVGRRFSAIFGFTTEKDASDAGSLIRKAARPAKKRR